MSYLELSTPQSLTFLSVEQLWISVLMAICFKKLLWWGLRDVLTYGYKEELRGQFITMSTFLRAYDPPNKSQNLPHLTVPGMDSILWSGFKFMRKWLVIPIAFVLLLPLYYVFFYFFIFSTGDGTQDPAHVRQLPNLWAFSLFTL